MISTSTEATARLYREINNRIHEVEWITTSRDLLQGCETEQAWLQYLQQLKEIPKRLAMKEIEPPQIINNQLVFRFWPTEPSDSQSSWYRMAHFSEL